MTACPGVSRKLIETFQKTFISCEKNILAQNVCVTQPLMEVCTNRAVKQTVQHVYNHKLETEGKPISDQQASGRCWIFACLNHMRLPFMKKYNIEEFEFSQTYLFFWDKLERANYLIDSFVDCAKKGETFEGRLISHLLRNPSEDGGQWDMLTNLVEKYGVVPKVLFPEAWSAQNSRRLGGLLNNRLRENCMVIQKMVADKKSEAEIEETKTKMMEEIYRILCITLGSPPSVITFQYYTKGGGGSGEGESKDKKKEQASIGPISPRDFYHTHIKPDCMDMEDYVCVVDDARPQNPYNSLYTVDYLGNMTGGRPVLYINKPIEVLKQLAIKAIVDTNTPVWFGCDVGQAFQGKDGVLDLNIMDYKLVFGVDKLKMSKSERLMFGESLMTHAMMFTGVNTKEGEGDTATADKWRVENSWGGDRGEKGYLTMTDEWFSQFVYEVVVSKKLLDADTLAILDQKPIVLPAWDPMGALAKC